MSRPVIGITTYVEPARFRVHDTVCAVLPYDYVESVESVGARVVLIPPDEGDADLLERLDGLVLAGGSDLDPGLYGEEPHPNVDAPRTRRDSGESVLLAGAMRLDLPVLAICRGMQLMAVLRGGRLHQHLPEVVGHVGHRPADSSYGEHNVWLEPGSLIRTLLGGDTVTVNSYHHQGIADPGSLTVTGRAPDGTVEVLEDPTRRFALGVQWHPERLADKRLFAALAEAATEAATEAAGDAAGDAAATEAIAARR